MCMYIYLYIYIFKYMYIYLYIALTVRFSMLLSTGTAFKVAKSYDKAKDAFLKAADAFAKNNSYLLS